MTCPVEFDLRKSNKSLIFSAKVNGDLQGEIPVDIQDCFREHCSRCGFVDFPEVNYRAIDGDTLPAPGATIATNLVTVTNPCPDRVADLFWGHTWDVGFASGTDWDPSLDQAVGIIRQDTHNGGVIIPPSDGGDDISWDYRGQKHVAADLSRTDLFSTTIPAGGSTEIGFRLFSFFPITTALLDIQSQRVSWHLTTREV